MMQAKIVGVNKLDFDSRDGKVQMSQLFVTFKDETETHLVGEMTGKINWNELERGKAPDIKLGDMLKVRYNKNGRLVIVE